MDFILTPLICLALNVYFESRDQPLIGQFAVAETVFINILPIPVIIGNAISYTYIP